MGAALLLARATLRREWRAVVALTVFVGLAGAVVLSAAAGARRTSTALDRFAEDTNLADIEIVVGDATDAQLAEFAGEPSVREVARLRQIAGQVGDIEQLGIGAALDEKFATIIDRPRLIRGRLPNNDAPAEVALPEALARRLAVGVGDRLPFTSFSAEQINEFFEGGAFPEEPNGPALELEVTGLVRRPGDLAETEGQGGALVLTPGFVARYGDEVGSFAGTVLRVGTANDAAAVTEALAASRRIFGEDPRFDAKGLAAEIEGPRDAVDVLTIALVVFAAIAAVAAGLTIALLVSRQVQSSAPDQPELVALGMSRSSRVLAAAVPAVPVALVGAVLASAIAALASRLFPFGIAGSAEPDPGLRLDVPVLGIGVLVIVVFIAMVATYVAVRATAIASEHVPRRSSRIATAARAGLAPPAAAGLDFALEPGRGSRAIPVRSAIVGAIVGMLGVVGTLVYAESFDQLVRSPGTQGWTWDAVVYPADTEWKQGPSGDCGDMRTTMTDDPAYTAVAAVCQTNLEIEGQPIAAWGITPLKSEIQPTIVSGRAPRADDEVALGGTTMRDLGKRIGDRVSVQSEHTTIAALVVGQVVLPSPVGLTAQPLADAAAFTGRGLVAVVGPDEEGGDRLPGGDFAVLARLAPGSSLDDANRNADGFVEFRYGTASTPAVPVEIDRLQQIDRLPLYLGLFLAVLGLVSIGHALFSTARRRRHDLAVLRTLGFDRRQVRATVASQATTFAVIGLVVGIPLGILVGQLVWRRVADGLGVSTRADVSVVAILLACAVTLVAANIAAVIAAQRGLRVAPADALTPE